MTSKSYHRDPQLLNLSLNLALRIWSSHLKSLWIKQGSIRILSHYSQALFKKPTISSHLTLTITCCEEPLLWNKTSSIQTLVEVSLVSIKTPAIDLKLFTLWSEIHKVSWQKIRHMIRLQVGMIQLMEPIQTQSGSIYRNGPICWIKLHPMTRVALAKFWSV